MSVLLEFAMFPTDQGESVSAYVSRVIEMIRETGIPYQLTPMGTILETETLEQALAVVQQAGAVLGQVALHFRKRNTVIGCQDDECFIPEAIPVKGLHHLAETCVCMLHRFHVVRHVFPGFRCVRHGYRRLNVVGIALLPVGFQKRPVRQYRSSP